ncbi:MAG: hypothetical protein HZA95_03705 [Candidatus Vogelbacteria bacterium]|nr:hypothetical protein [Candidatus Vogelbacteria bacterium]
MTLSLRNSKTLAFITMVGLWILLCALIVLGISNVFSSKNDFIPIYNLSGILFLIFDIFIWKIIYARSVNQMAELSKIFTVSSFIFALAISWYLVYLPVNLHLLWWDNVAPYGLIISILFVAVYFLLKNICTKS